MDVRTEKKTQNILLRGTAMRREYDIFEKFPDGTPIWRGCLFGLFETERKIRHLAQRSGNEFFAIDIRSGERVALSLVDGKLQPIGATLD